MNLVPKLSDLLDVSINTTTRKKTGLEDQTQEQLIDSIRQHMVELHCRGLIFDSSKFHQDQLYAIKSLKEWNSTESKSLASIITIDSIPTPILSKDEELIKATKAMKFLWNGVKDTLRNYVSPIMQEINTQTRIEELENILRKHPNRSDVRVELMKLKKTVKPKIGRKKKK